MNQTDTWNLQEDQILIWDFFGPHSQPTCLHFAKHLREELVLSIVKKTAGAEDGLEQKSFVRQVITYVETEGHHNFCAAWVSRHIDPQKTKALKPQRMCAPEQFLTVYPLLFEKL